MTLAEAEEIFAYWADNPPAHLMIQAIARLVGWSPPPPATPPADIAAAVSFFASEDAGFITGQRIIVDGGRSLGT